MFHHAKLIAPWVLGFGLLVCWALFMFFPAFPKSATGWLALVFVGIPLCFAAELIGTWVFGTRYAARWPRWVRLSYGVVTALVVLGLLYPPLVFVQGLVAS